MSHANFNKLTKHYWIWPIAWDLFLGALGGGILALVALFDLIYKSGVLGVSSSPIPEVGAVFAVATFIAVAALGIASAMLIFELGQPQVFYRVFLSGTAVIKYGAVAIMLSVVFGFVYFLFCLPPEWALFYYSWVWIKDICCVLMLITGICVMLYTGLLLSSMKAKPFWNTPVLPVLFVVSGFAMAASTMAITAGVWPASTFGFDAELITYFKGHLHAIAAICLAGTFITLLVYILLQYGAGNKTARTVAIRWLKGQFALGFWVGVMVCGVVVPFVFFLSGGVVADTLAPILVVASGLLLRFLIVYSDDRTAIPGEERFWSRMPDPHDKFLTAWKK
jgi:polysulfide reductase chain C